MAEVRPIDAGAFEKDLLELANIHEAEENYEAAAEDRLIAYHLRLVPTLDHYEKVVYCDECVNHGHCTPEDTFRLVGMEKPFCAAGGERAYGGQPNA